MAIRFVLRACVLLLLTGALLASASAQDFKKPLTSLDLQPGDTIVFLGDSITHQCLYTQYIEDYFYTRFPKVRLKFHNAGVGGARVKDALLRFDRDVAFYKPKYVTVLLGMNDGEKKPYDEALFQKYRKDMKELIGRITGIGATPILMTPTMFDSRASRLLDAADKSRKTPPEQLELYNSVLAYYGAWLREIATDNGHGFVDMYSPLTNLTLDQRKTDPNFTFIKDAVHPDAPGQLVMAVAIIESFNFPGQISKIKLWKDDEGQPASEIEGGQISDLTITDDLISFTWQADSLPWVVPDEAQLGAQLTGLGNRLSQERLEVQGLPPATYELKIDDAVVGSFTTELLARHIELQSNTKTPQYAQALKVAELNRARNNTPVKILRAEWIDFQTFARVRLLRDAQPGNPRLEAQLADLEKKLQGREDRIKKAEADALAAEDKIFQANVIPARKYVLTRTATGTPRKAVDLAGDPTKTPATPGTPTPAGDKPKELSEAGKFFTSEVLPILKTSCYSCHGDVPKPKGGLKLTTRELALKGGDSGPAVLTDKPEESLLLHAIGWQDEQLRMPPKAKLPQEKIDVLTRWVKQGLPFADAAPIDVASNKPKDTPTPDKPATPDKPKDTPTPDKPGTPDKPKDTPAGDKAATIALKLQKKISVVSLQEQTLADCLEIISLETGVKFELAADDLKAASVPEDKLTLQIDDTPAVVVLDKLISKLNLVVVVDEEKKTALVTTAKAAEDRKLPILELEPEPGKPADGDKPKGDKPVDGDKPKDEPKDKPKDEPKDKPKEGDKPKGTDVAAAKFFSDEVLPILKTSCYGCHGEIKKPKGNLKMTTRELLLKGGDNGPAVDVEKPDESLLLTAIGYADETLKMPPKAKLSQEKIDILTKWVKQGAPWAADPAGSPEPAADKPADGDKPKDEPKDKPKEEPKDQPKEEPKDKPKDEPKDPPKEEPKDKPKAGDTPKGTDVAAAKFFSDEVLPILRTSCYGCHGEIKKPKGNLKMTTRELLLKGGDNGPAVDLEKPGESLFLTAINYEDETLKMPPKAKLSQEKIDILTRWVKQGAPWSADPAKK